MCIELCASNLQAYVRGWRVRRDIRQEQRQMHLERVTRVVKVHLATITIQVRFKQVMEGGGREGLLLK